MVKCWKCWDPIIILKKVVINGAEVKFLHDRDTRENEILSDLKSLKYHDLENLMYRMQLTYVEIIDILDLKYIPTKKTGYSLLPGIYETTDINKTQEDILFNNVNIKITIDDIRLKSKFYINQTLIFTKKSFFLHNIRFESITFRTIS